MIVDTEDFQTWVLPEALAAQARQRPLQRWITMVGGDALTFGEADEQVSRVATHLHALGVRPGDHVAVLLPNGLDFVRVWLALGRLGAVAVLLNTELTGRFLQHQLQSCGAAMAIVDSLRAHAIAAVVTELTQLQRVIVVDAEDTVVAAAIVTLPWNVWRTTEPQSFVPPKAQDIACIMYTSGTTGPSKGVQMPHAHCCLFAIGAVESVELGPEDCYYIVLPLFHANGLLMQLAATLIVGIEAVIRERFSANAWLDDIRTYGVTVTNSLGVIVGYVLAQPPTEFDRDHRLRVVGSAPNVPEHEAALRSRFGVRDVISGYGMTEVNIVVWGRIGESCPGAAGWVQQGRFDILIVDPETDAPLRPRQIGEILVRPRLPWCTTTGYYGEPGKTVEAWRNLWFHTGDAGFVDDSGLLTFVDRIKDCIRRRGENISAAEVEAAIAQRLPGIAELAAFAIPAQIAGGEDEVMLAVVPCIGSDLTPQAVAACAEEVVPRFARPRYIEFLSELPKTATGKVQRAQLRQRGLSPSVWDAESARAGSSVRN